MPSLTNSANIEQIRNFCQKKGVTQTDLLEELTAELAEKIDRLQQDEKDLSFDQALQQVYKTYGITGFSQWRSEKSQQAYEWQRDSYYNILKSFLKFPKLSWFLILVFLHAAAVFVLGYKTTFISLLAIAGILLIVDLVWVIRNNKKAKSHPRQNVLYSPWPLTFPLFVYVFFNDSERIPEKLDGLLPFQFPLITSVLAATYFILWVAQMEFRNKLGKGGI